MLLAHQGGWDETLFVLAPLLVIGGLLLLANRRAKARGPVPNDGSSTDPDKHDAEGTPFT
jgi:hypothetical protein